MPAFPTFYCNEISKFSHEKIVSPSNQSSRNHNLADLQQFGFQIVFILNFYAVQRLTCQLLKEMKTGVPRINRGLTLRIIFVDIFLDDGRLLFLEFQLQNFKTFFVDYYILSC